jgi:hypothetical protein
MRGDLLRLLPVFSERFHLTPRVFWGLTYDEFDAYMTHLQETVTEGGGAYGAAI